MLNNGINDKGINEDTYLLFRSSFAPEVVELIKIMIVAKEPTRQLVAEWVVDVYKNLPAQTVRNAWMKNGFEWF